MSKNKINESLISIIICSYNRPKLLERAVESVLNQSYENIEIVVVDDASFPDNREIMKSSQVLKDNRVKIIWLPENKGVSNATNIGFEQSHGNFIALLGDDDYWIDPKKLEKQVALFNQSRVGLKVIGTWWFEKKTDGMMVQKKPQEPKNWKAKLLSGGGVICGSTPLIKREAWITVGGLDERLLKGTDSDLFRRIIISGYDGIIIPEFTTVVDVGHGGIRMTAVENNVQIWKGIYTHSYLIKKYFVNYVLHPTAFAKRIKLIFSLFRRLTF